MNPLPLSRYRFPIALFSIALTAMALRADVSPSPLFSDHAVLQAAKSVPVWGMAEPGERVTVSISNSTASAVANAEGKWQANLDLSSVGPGPFDLNIQGRNQLIFTDVLVGQVWLCSGQSNMEWPLRGSGGASEEIPQSANLLLRHFKVEKNTSVDPTSELKGKWVVATPETTPNFTAAGYYFGKMIQSELQTPVGLVNATWGGTPVEAWTRLEAFDQDAELKDGAANARRAATDYKTFIKAYQAWMSQNDREDRPPADPKDFDGITSKGTEWTPVKLPGLLTDAGLPDAGAIWICQKVTLPPGALGSPLQVWFGDVRDSVKIYWNGAPVAQGGIETTAHRYSIPGKLVTETENVLSARIFAPSGGIGINPGPTRFRIDYKGGSLQLAGEWVAKAECAFPPLAAGATPCPTKPPLPLPDHFVAAYLYNAMINPLIPMAFAGVIWDQGSQNADRAWQYRVAFPLMIADWRAKWGQGDFPFYFCQLANFQPPPKDPGQSSWAEVREGQAAALKLPATGMAVLIDVGDANDIHPADKKSAGERLARQALANTYGKSVTASGPMLSSWKIEGDKVHIDFRHTDGGLVTKPIKLAAPRPDSEVQGFALSGEDRKWYWAQAKIEGDSVIAWCPEVPAPKAIRYAWADNPLCNLTNGAGLPAAPFRTDDFPLISQKNRY